MESELVVTELSLIGVSEWRLYKIQEHRGRVPMFAIALELL